MNAFSSLRFHWPEYLMEAGELTLYMFVTCALATLLQHPASPVGHLIVNGFFRWALMGLGMGATVVAIITSPWGKQSGAHFNPGGFVEASVPVARSCTILTTSAVYFTADIEQSARNY